jgi:hypothetical protein
MGLFSKEVLGKCYFCQSDIIKKIFASGIQLKDGNSICYVCVNRFTQEFNLPLEVLWGFSAAKLQTFIKSKEIIISNGFVADKKIIRKGAFSLLEIDNNHGLINLPFYYRATGALQKDTYINYIKPISQIVNFEYMENDNTIIDGNSLTRAGVGGVLFGGVGAIVGSGTGKRELSGICKSMKIKVDFNDLNDPFCYIDILGNTKFGVQKGNILYQNAFNTAQECISILQTLVRNIKHGDSPTGSAADEILKFKKLLDAGAITQEEYDKKKKELLGL